MPEETTLLTDTQNASRVRKRDHLVTKFVIEVGTPVPALDPKTIGDAAEVHAQLLQSVRGQIDKIPGIIPKSTKEEPTKNQKR